MRVLLIATYEMGRQPFGLASPAAFLRAAGHEVDVQDASIHPPSLAAVRRAQLIAFHLPMHTATRLAAPLITRVRAEASPQTRVVCYGLYAPINAEYLRSLGASAILGGEFEEDLVRLAGGQDPPHADSAASPASATISLARLDPFPVPDRSQLPPLASYAALVNGEGATATAIRAGYTEASRGCKHRCRHCPVVPVYNGQFRVVPPETVLADIRQQVELGGARHITFGDPDFFNGPTHARRLVEALAAQFSGLTYDVTIKVEHLLRHRDLLPILACTGCAFVTTAVESLDDRVLALLEKGHTRADFLTAAELCRAAGLALSPTFISFTPWTTRESYRDLLRTLASLGLAGAGHVAPIQLALRLLITNNSRLLELDDIRRVITAWDPVALTHRWRHPDPAVDALAARLLLLVDECAKSGLSRAETFARIWDAAEVEGRPWANPLLPSRATIPYLTEPWYC